MNKQTLLELIQTTRNEDELSALIDVLYDLAELENLEKRASILKMLTKEDSYKQIEAKTGASSATISKVSQKLKANQAKLLNYIRRIKK